MRNLVFGAIVTTFFLTLNMSAWAAPEVGGDDDGPNPASAAYYLQRAFPNKTIPTNSKELSFNSLKKFLKDTGGDHTGLDWQQMGPVNIGGRLTDVVAHPDFPNRVFIGTAEGGVWKSEDGGSNFDPIFTQEGTLSIGALAIDPKDPNTLWVGTGEANPALDTYAGMGLFVSHNLGKSFQRAGLEDSGRIGRIRIDPRDSNHLYVAVTGDIFVASKNRGVYESHDAGKTWTQILASKVDSDQTGAIDLVINPKNPDEIYASLWDLFRTETSTKKGGPGSGLYHSMDAGKTWTQITNGLPATDGNTGRIGIAMYDANPNIVYVIFDEAGQGFNGIYRTDDGGKTWNPMHGLKPGDDYGLDNYGWWFGNMRVSPNDPNTLYVLALELWKSTDGGQSFKSLNPDQSNVHADQHALWFNPSNPDHIYVGDDGGFYSSPDGGQTFSKADLPITQFYHLTVDPKNSNHIYGGAQDNNVLRTLTGSLNDWTAIYGGDGMSTLLDPTDPNTIFCEADDGDFSISHDNAQTFTEIAPNYIRSGWDSPVRLDPLNPKTVYFGGEALYQSDDEGTTWKTISPEFETFPAGALPTSYIVSIFDIPTADPKVIYAGTDVGHIFLTRDHGVTWSNVTNNLPQRFFTSVKVRPDAPNEVYVTISGFAIGSVQTHVFRSLDYGTTWENIGKSLPEAPMNSIALDPLDRKTFYVGSDVGVFRTQDAGASWEFIGTGLPLMVPVTDITVDPQGQFLTVATHGRGMWRLKLRN